MAELSGLLIDHLQSRDDRPLHEHLSSREYEYEDEAGRADPEPRNSRHAATRTTDPEYIEDDDTESIVEASELLADA